jgi:hypothetical protein
VTDRRKPSRALQALTAAAFALPGMTPARADDTPSFNVQYGHYEEGKRDLDGQSYSTLTLKPLEVDSFAVDGSIPIFDRTTVKGEFTQDSWSGATPVVSLPGAAVGAQLMAGASSPNFYHIDEDGTPVVVDFNDYDPDTDTYAFARHPGLVHIMASASPETRRQWDGSITHAWDRAELTIGGGISDEHDYLSRFVNVGGKFDFNNKLTVLNWGASMTRNRIRASIAANSAADTGNYTDRIRDFHGEPTIFGRRKDFAADAGVTQILNRGALVQLDIGYTRSTGFLENPYKAVIFAFDDPDEQRDNSGLKYIAIKGSLEQRPDVRSQWAANVRFTQHLARTDGGLHLNYRFYRDNWGIRSHTAEVTLDQPLGGGWMLTPDARYYSQTAANFYAPFFLFDEAYPAHPGGPLDRDKIPLKYFSSDERLSAFGAISGSLALQKSLGHGVALDLAYEYYVHKGSLTLGGGGEPAYADFHSSLISGGLSMDLARRQDEIVSNGVETGAELPDQLLTIRPAGLLLPDAMRTGALALSAAFSGTGGKGPVEFKGRAVTNNDLIAKACGATPCKLSELESGHNELRFELSYAMLPRLTFTVAPTYVENSLTLVDVFPDSLAGPLPPLGGPSGSGRHASSGWGDTQLLGSYTLIPAAQAQVRLGGGISVPTGQAGRKLSGKTDYASYGLQTGSGTWDAIGVLDLEGSSGPVRLGAELAGVKRLGTNKVGYRIGDQVRADLWAGSDLAPWLNVAGRLHYVRQGVIHGGYKDHLEHNVPFSELQQVDYDVNGDGVVDSQDVDYVTVYRDAEVGHVVASSDDVAANHGGNEVDAGIDVTLHAASGPFKGDRLSVEWLKPISTDLKGYQLCRSATVNAKVTIAI